MKYLIKLTYFLICCFCLCNDIAAQEFQVKAYTAESGLPQNRVNGITQGDNGVMWFATNSGIAKFDGYQWTTFLKEKGKQRRNTRYIKKGANGNIWVVGERAHYGMFFTADDGKTWQEIRLPSDKIPPGSFFTDFLCDPSPHQDLKVIATRREGVLLLRNNKWELFNTTNGLASNFVRSVLVIGDTLLIASDSALSILNLKSGKLDRADVLQGKLPSIPVKKLYPVYTAGQEPGMQKIEKFYLIGKDWIGEYEDDFRLLAANLNFVQMKMSRIPAVALEAGKHLYFGSNMGINVLNLQTLQITDVGQKNGIITEGATDIFIDAEENIWISGYPGLTKIISKRFKNFNHKTGLLDDEVHAIQQMDDGTMVFGHTNGLSFYDGEKYWTKSFGEDHRKFADHLRTMEMAKDRQGNIWVAAKKYGIFKIQPDRSIKYIQISKKRKRSLYSVLINDKDEVVFSTSNEIFKVVNDKVVPSSSRKNTKRHFRKIFLRENGTLLITTVKSGIISYKNNQFKRTFATKNWHKESTYSIFEQNDGSLLVGTAGGVFQSSGDTLIRKKFNGQEIRKPVYFIIRDLEQRLWFGTNYGVYFWDENNLQHFSTAHGLVGLETNRSGGFLDKDGQVWIGTNRGASCFSPDENRNVQKPPILRLTNLQLADQMYSLDKEINLDYTQSELRFHFSCISMTDENFVKYRFRLKGYDTDWIENRYFYNSQIRYTNLPPGKFLLEVQAKNNLSDWSETVSSAYIYIHEPFWYQWWFYLFVLLLVTLFLLAIYRFLAQKRIAGELELAVAERTKALIQTEQKYHSLFMESADTVFISTKEGRFIDINPAGVELFGYLDRSELLSKDIAKSLYIDPLEREKYVDMLIQNGSVKNYELKLCKKDGTELSVSVSATVDRIGKNGEIVFRGIVRDETERKKLERQFFHAQKMESIGILAGGIAHDFNNILGGVLGYASLMKMKMKDSDPLIGFADAIEKGAKRAAELTGQLLAFARGGKYQVQNVDLNEIIRDVVKIIKPTFHKSIDIRVNLKDALSFISADPGQMQQVVMNLCVNARDAIEGNGNLTIRTEEMMVSGETAGLLPDLNEGEYVLLTISDSGCGMNEEILSKIFEPFFTTKGKSKGTGLGLAMVYGVVKNHQGTILVGSQPGKGSEFKIYLPVSSQPDIQETTVVQVTPTSGTETILVVDDEEILRELLRTSLENQGYRILTATNGLEALEVYEKSKDEISLVLMDMVMPKMGGRETIEKMMLINPELKFIVTTGFSQQNDLEEVFKMSKHQFIQKPFKVKEMLERIRYILDEKQPVE